MGCLVLGVVLFAPGHVSAEPSAVTPTSTAVPTTSSVTATAPKVIVPAKATPEMKEFEQISAVLAEKMRQWHSQNGSDIGKAQDFAQFRKQNADLLKRQSQLGQIIAQQQAKNPLPLPPPLSIPANAPPEMKAYLTKRDQLMRDQVAFINEHRADLPAQRQAAMQQWRQQNGARFLEIQKQAQAIAQNAPRDLSPPTNNIPEDKNHEHP